MPSHGPHVRCECHHHHTHADDSRHPGDHHLLTVEGLTVAYRMYDPQGLPWRPCRVQREVLHDLTLSVHEGEVLALVGASGSGKSVLADALMGIFDPNAVARGRMWFDGRRVDPLGFPRLRGCGITLVPQGVSYLDPLMRVGEQVRGEARGADRRARARDAERRLRRQRDLFEAYGLAPEVEKMYPHELSGGMARRVLLMCALMEEPRVLIADEPTPGMDDGSSAVAARDLRAFADEGGGVLLITHDLDFAMRIADRLAVFRGGTVVEETSVSAFVDGDALQDAFARELSAAWARLHERPSEGGGAADGVRDQSPSSWEDASAHAARLHPTRCEDMAPLSIPADDHGAATVLSAENVAYRLMGGDTVFEGVECTLRAGERLALLGSSGAGKSTLCRVLAGQLVASEGVIAVGSEGVKAVGSESAPMRSRRGRPHPVQLVAQHPECAFDPCMSLGRSLDEAGDPLSRDAEKLFERFGVEVDWLTRRPHEVSGGQLMRLALVRALMTHPRVLICDETTASLDLCAQEEIWHALLECQLELGFGLILVSHDSALVNRVATRSIRLENGRLIRNSSIN